MVLNINLTTGPVHISKEVKQAFMAPPISHRSAAYLKAHHELTYFLKESFSVKETFILSGSGTLANEAMLQEIKQINGEGLILSNGEFGNRLMEQVKRNELLANEYSIDWGLPFDLREIEQLIQNHKPKWILFCHCETSTGIINDLASIVAIAEKYNCSSFIDCMSSVGTMPINLSKVAMATASSGKGLSSLPGIALVFSNIDCVPKPQVPGYLDLGYYKSKNGIPFTISSNLLHALFTAVHQKLQPAQYTSCKEFGESINEALQQQSLVPFSNGDTKVFTIVPSLDNDANTKINYFRCQGLDISFESEYLIKRTWSQLAILGYYTHEEIDYVLKCMHSNKQIIKNISKATKASIS